MRLLLDTHAFLWWSEGNPRLRVRTRRAIAAAETVVVSAASAWEAAIKIALGRLSIRIPFEQAVEINAFEQLPITFAHVAAVTGLAPHHRDPFDRMLIAQAFAEGLTIVTHDPRFEAYGVPVLWT
ncbi:MAG: type II toxin-antitoxin system VapC family toxin [Gemmatimonadetes bacterium]|nr:type II toxin-antitoxin system VapC family toxin [Gemmatimonadota bacterium]